MQVYSSVEGGVRSEIAQSRSQAPERSRKDGGKRTHGRAMQKLSCSWRSGTRTTSRSNFRAALVILTSFLSSLKNCAGAAIIAPYPNVADKNKALRKRYKEIVDRARRSGAGNESAEEDLPDDFHYYSQINAVVTGRPSVTPVHQCWTR